MSFKSKSHFGTIFGRTWDHFFANFWKFFWVAVVLTLVQVVATELIQWLFVKGGSETMAPVAGLLLFLVSIILGGVLIAGMYHVAKGAQGGGNAPGVGESIAKGFARWWKFTLMILRLIWFVMWPALLALLVLGGVWYLVWGGVSQAAAQSPEGAAVPAEATLDDFDFSQFQTGPESFSVPMGAGPWQQFSTIFLELAGKNKGSVAFGGFGLLVITLLIVWRTVQATFSFAVLSDKNGGVGEALKGSLEAVEGRWWIIFGNLFFLYLLTAGLFVLVAVGGGALVLLLTWLLSAIGLGGAVTVFVVAKIVPLLVAGFSAGIGVLFHYELYKA